jgi:hypothetical protein
MRYETKRIEITARDVHISPQGLPLGQYYFAAILYIIYFGILRRAKKSKSF